MDVLRKKGLTVIESWTPPIPIADASADVVYADQVLEHMSGIDAARQFTAEAFRSLRPGGIFFVVVPDYLKERTFFWDVDYTHNFVTTERRVRQLFNDNGFEILHVERSIGVATGVARDALAAGALLVNLPGVERAVALHRHRGSALQDPQEPVRNAHLRRPQAGLNGRQRAQGRKAKKDRAEKASEIGAAWLIARDFRRVTFVLPSAFAFLCR